MSTQHDPILRLLMGEAERYPVLTPEREREIAIAWRARQDRVALSELVGSHQRFVLKIARGFIGYGLPLADLVSEGNVGLMQAASRFDPERGFRFATYAKWWIRAAIHQYILHSWSLVKIGTTVGQKRLFFNLRRLKARLKDFDGDDLFPETVATIANDLQVAEREVMEMNCRMASRDTSLNAIVDEADGEPIELLPDQRPNQETVLSEIDEDRQRRALVLAAFKTLNLREREIVVERLKEDRMTLEELADRFAVSRERIRQIEERAISKMALAVADNTKKQVENNGAYVL
jgi:RNA polymerase sigma-32 factor